MNGSQSLQWRWVQNSAGSGFLCDFLFKFEVPVTESLLTSAFSAVTA